jgi:xanthine dehydrogenase YagR molybdenum-binding subunit
MIRFRPDVWPKLVGLARFSFRVRRLLNETITASEARAVIADGVHEIDVIFVDERNELVNPIGAKGLGEIGVVGVAAAIANAVFHATGKRIREWPITLDKVI